MSTKKSKTFYTLFPLTANVHLLKDVGMIPYILHRDYHYDSTIVCFKNGQYEALENEVQGLHIQFIPRNKNYVLGKPSPTVINYLKSNAKAIDILNLYHTTKETLVYGLIYKMYNPKGFLYIKTDINLQSFNQSITSIKRKLYSFYFNHISSLVSCELTKSTLYLQTLFPAAKGNIIKISNGIDQELTRYNRVKVFSEKENLIIAVGRIGAPEKNHELLLNALKRVQLKDWKVAFVGPVNPEFQPIIDSFFEENPDKKNNILFPGAIYNRTLLYEWYNRAKCICQTSRWESFGIVLVEALYFGDYILSTPIDSIDELTKGGTIGSILKDDESWARELQDIINGKKEIEQCYDAIRKHGNNYIWTDILAPLDKRLKFLDK